MQARKTRGRSRQGSASRSGQRPPGRLRAGAEAMDTCTDPHTVIERYHALLNALPDLMFVQDRNGIFIDYWAGKAEDLALPADQIIGTHVRDVGFTKKDLDAIQRKVRRVLTTGKMQTHEYSLQMPGGVGHYETRIVRLNRNECLSIVRNITASRQAEEALRQASDRLEAEKATLHEKNIALEEVLNHLDARANARGRQIRDEITRELGPLLTHLRTLSPPELQKQIDAARERLEAILAEDADTFQDRYGSLTPRELQLCDLLRAGLSSKQISERLNLSLATVHKHREQVRRKLGFRGRQVNLQAYLRLHAAPD